jgi:phosphate transport system permease protein
MAQAVISTPITAEVLRGNPARLRRERRMRVLFFSAALLSVLISIAIVLSLLGGTIDFLRKVDLSTLWSDGWLPRNNLFDIKTIVAGTLIVALIAMVVAAPLGLGAAFYLSEYATPRARRYLKPIIETLASIPSVVLGYFAIRVISPELVQRLFGSQVPLFNMLAAGIAVGLLVTPLVASVAEDAMHAGSACAPRSIVRARSSPPIDQHPCRVSGGGLGYHRRAHLGGLARDRGDDDRRDRRRGDGRLPLHLEPARRAARR